MSIAFLGTGLMGAPMAARLLGAGHRVAVWNRSPEKTRDLAAAGAVAAASPAAALDGARTVITMLADAGAIREVLLAPACREALSGRTVVQMATIAPEESRSLDAEVRSAGGRYLEAPVLGSIPEARDGRLLVMVGARADDYAAHAELLAAFGQSPLHVGAVGQAAALKLALNQLIAALTAAFSFSLALVQREGLEVDTFMGVLRESALYAPTFDKKLGKMLEHDYANPNFPVRHLLKDVRLVLAAAGRQGLETGALAAIGDLLEATVDAGRGDEDYSALHEAVAGRPDRA